MPRLRFNRWSGALAGALIALGDTLFLRSFGIAFDMRGWDVTWLVGAWFGSSLALAGFLAGYSLELRRRERRSDELLRKQMDEIRATRARLAHAERLAAMGELAAAITHEVRNPLAIIRSAAQGLTETLGTDDGEARRACGFITAEIDRLANVVTSLLGFARPLHLRVGAVPVPALVDRALLLAHDELQVKSARVTRREADSLPAAEVDADLMCQVVLCLVSNAAEAVPVGGEIALEATGKNGSIELTVGDSGPGVPAELRDRIFEPFFTTRSRGVGLGLAVARQIVEAHGGKIAVGGSALGGALFTVRLPTRAAPA